MPSCPRLLAGDTSELRRFSDLTVARRFEVESDEGGTRRELPLRTAIVSAAHSALEGIHSRQHAISHVISVAVDELGDGEHLAFQATAYGERWLEALHDAIGAANDEGWPDERQQQKAAMRVQAVCRGRASRMSVSSSVTIGVAGAKSQMQSLV